MSLTHYVRQYEATRHLFASLPDLADKFTAVAGRPKRGSPQLVPRTAADPILLGTAFDYWIRGWLARNWPDVSRRERPWVAEKALMMMGHLSDVFASAQGQSASPEGLSPEFRHLYDDSEAKRKRHLAIESHLREVKDLHAAYIAGDDGVLRDYLRGCLFLARLDAHYRAGVVYQDYLTVDEKDLGDLTALAALTEERRQLFTPRHRIWLNPDFGAMGSLIIGGDADLLIDDQLIDVKVTQARSPRTEYQRQLIGYWLLAAMEGEPWPVETLCVKIEETADHPGI